MRARTARTGFCAGTCAGSRRRHGYDNASRPATGRRPGGGSACHSPRSAFYRAVWRWHFYAGLFAIPVIVLLCLSGIVYLFRPQLDGLMYGHLRDVPVGHDQATYQSQLVSGRGAFPKATIVSAQPPPEADRSTQFDIVTADAGDNRSVYVDPYSTRLLGSPGQRSQPDTDRVVVAWLADDRPWLGNEKWGDWFIEIIAGWAILLLVTGIILWWPRGVRRTTMRGVLVPRWRHNSSRVTWRDVHAITGVLFAFISLFFLVTGMAWTGWWGTKYQEVATKVGSSYPDALLNGVSSTKVGDLATTGKTPWASSSLPVALSGEPGNKATQSSTTGRGWCRGIRPKVHRSTRL